MEKDETNASRTAGRIRLVPRTNEAIPIIAIGRRPMYLNDIYVRLLGITWPKLIGLTVLLYGAINLLFALAYLSIDGGIDNARSGSFADAFFFSVQTMATIGYGKMAPSGTMANLLVSAEALLGFGFFAMITGLAFSKFSRPTARLMFSDVAVVCPYEGVPHLMMRLANERENRIVDAKINLTMLRNEVTREGHNMRRFHDLPPVRNHVPLLRLTWTVMHRIDEQSPLYNIPLEKLCEDEVEIIISISGLDETLSQTIHARHSYVAEEIMFAAVFEDILDRQKNGLLQVDYHLFHKTRPLSPL